MGLMGPIGPHALSAESESTTAAASHLLARRALTNRSVSSEKFADNPKLPLNDSFHRYQSRSGHLTRAASKINEIEASTALERGTRRSNPCRSPGCRSRAGAKGGQDKALEYMAP